MLKHALAFSFVAGVAAVAYSVGKATESASSCHCENDCFDCEGSTSPYSSERIGHAKCTGDNWTCQGVSICKDGKQTCHGFSTYSVDGRTCRGLTTCVDGNRSEDDEDDSDFDWGDLEDDDFVEEE